MFRAPHRTCCVAVILLTAALLCASGAPLAAMTATPPAIPATVIDINRFGAGSSLAAFTPFQGRLYFLRSNVGVELWRSDGTPAGTTLVKTLNAAQSFTRSGLRLFAAAAQLFIVIDDYSLGGELWAGDGTEAGTRMLLPLPRNKYFLPPMATLGNRLFFPHYDEPSGQELWVSDGTVAGTQRVADINPGDASSFPQYLTRAGDHLYFAADDGTHATTLWLSDGTDVGTRRVDAATPGTIPPSPSHLTPVGDWLYFGVGGSLAHPFELWRTRGTAATSERIRTWTEAGEWVIHEAVALGDSFYAAIGPPSVTERRQLWVSDGTPAGTRQLIELETIRELTVVGRQIFFLGNDGVHGGELWASDGTAAGTRMVRDIAPGGDGYGWSAPASLLAVGDRLFFAARLYLPADDRWEAGLWTSDGTAAGTQELYRFQATVNAEMPHSLTNLDGVVLFAGWEEATGYELWRSDGTPGGTHLLKDITTATQSAGPRYLTELQGRVVFTANDGLNGYELWASDGNTAGTQLLADLAPGPASEEPWPLVRFGDRIYFVVDAGQAFGTLWATDGTPQGTTPFGMQVYNTSLTVSGGRLFFSAFTGKGDALYTSDGTPAGTALVSVITPGPAHLIDSGGRLFFNVGERLWVSDGTTAGTRQIADSPIAPSAFAYSGTATIGSRFFFVGADATYGSALWVSDGTPAGTQLVKDLAPGPGSASPTSFTVLGPTLYFIETVGCELWRSDGTAAGTQPVKRFAPTPGPYGGTFCPLQLARSGGKLFLSAAEQPGDVELWVSDGTAAGTRLVKDIQPGEQGSSPQQLTDIYGTLLFAAADGVNGRELWASDGTAAGTRLLADLAPGLPSGSPEALLVAADRLFFSAYDLQAGTELWVVALHDLGLPVNRLYLPIARRW